MEQLLKGVPAYREEDSRKYIEKNWWRGMTLGDLLDRAADMHPDKEAFVDRTTRYTYGQAREKVDRLALGLLRLGIQPLERVLIQLPNWNEFVFSYFACQKIGAVTVLLIERYRPFEINRLAEITGATAWIVPKRTHKVDFVPIVDDVLGVHPEIRNVITVRGTVERPGFSCLETLIEENERTPDNLERLAERRPDPMQVAHMGPTGGTTGAPKVVPRIHNSLICGVESCAMAWEQHCEDVNLIAGPIGHDLSFTKGLLGAIVTQGKVVLLSTTDNLSICECMEKEKVTAVIWVPTLAKRLMQYEDLGKYDLGSLRKMHSAGGASHPDLVREVMEKLHVRFYNGYGGTEGMTCITRTVDDCETICRTVGRPTFPHDNYKVVDPYGNALPVGANGELLVKGPCVFSGYYDNPEENAKVFDRDGFFRTGDLAAISDKGYIALTGRAKEMINRGGESISATEIERLIGRHPRVAAVAVIAMPDELMGERVCAYVEPLNGAQLAFDGVIAFLKEQNASVLQLPERIEFVEAMPVTATQKLDKKALREDIERKLLAEKNSPAQKCGTGKRLGHFSGPRNKEEYMTGKEIRLHGRGGQGAVMAAKMLATAFALENKSVASFPMYGFERRGMPVVAFTRFDDKPIREKTQIYTPDCLMVVDPTLLAITTLFDGLKPGGVLILNSVRPLTVRPSTNLERVGRINATGVALEEIGRDIPNTCLIGALAATTGWISLDSVLQGLGEYLEGDLLEKNIRNATRGYNEVEVQSWHS